MCNDLESEACESGRIALLQVGILLALDPAYVLGPDMLYVPLILFGTEVTLGILSLRPVLWQEASQTV